MTVPLSVLDLAPISEGSDAPTALRNTVDLAQHAELWGYRRYWLAEHHELDVAPPKCRRLVKKVSSSVNSPAKEQELAAPDQPNAALREDGTARAGARQAS